MLSSSIMDDKCEVNLESQPINRFVLDKPTNSYIYSSASKGTAESYKIQETRLLREEEFYRYDEIDSEIKNLDVESLKYTPKLKEKILHLMESFEVRINVLTTEKSIEGLLLLPYASLCQIRVPYDFGDDLDGLLDPSSKRKTIAEAKSTANKYTNVYSPVTEFRKRVIKIMNNYVNDDKNDVDSRTLLTEAVRSSLTPELFLVRLIENRRSVYTYSRLVEKVLARLSPEDRKFFKSDRNVDEFLDSLDNLASDNLPSTFFESMGKFMNVKEIIRAGDSSDGLREATMVKLYDYGEEFVKLIRQYNTDFTAEQQLILYRYHWIKTWYNALRQHYVNRQGASDPEPEVLRSLMSVQEMFKGKNSELKVLEKILESRKE